MMKNKISKLFFRQIFFFLIKEKNLILNFIFFLSILLAFLLFIFSIVFNQNIEDDKKRFNVVLNFKNSYADRGYSQQTVEGICESFKIKIPPLGKEKCNGSNKYFKNQTISYGFPGTMENPIIIEKYVDNFSNIDNFVFPGFSYNTFLKEKSSNLNTKWKQKNFLTIDTNFRPDDGIWPSNLYQIEIKQFLAGYHAALYSGFYALTNPDKFLDFDSKKEGKQIAFGALGGLLILPIINYCIGFQLGLKVINENREKLLLGTKNKVIFKKYQTIGGFDSSQWSGKTKEYSKQMYKEKISVIFSIATDLTKVINLAAEEMDKDKGNDKHWVVGVDVDQGVIILDENTFEINKENRLKGKILVSAILNIRKMVSSVVNNYHLKFDEKIDAKGKIVFGNVDDGQSIITIPKRFRENILWKNLVETIDIKLSPEKLKKLEEIASKISEEKCDSKEQCSRKINKIDFKFNN